MIIQMETRDPRLFSELQEAAKGPSGRVPDNCVVHEPVRDTSKLHALGGIEVISFVAGIGTSIGINLFSSWLYGRIKGRASNLRIDNEHTEITEIDIRTRIERVTRHSTSTD
jgi:hypothetical protein